jgi:hypothetical protein
MRNLKILYYNIKQAISNAIASCVFVLGLLIAVIVGYITNKMALNLLEKQVLEACREFAQGTIKFTDLLEVIYKYEEQYKKEFPSKVSGN